LYYKIRNIFLSENTFSILQYEFFQIIYFKIKKYNKEVCEDVGRNIGRNKLSEEKNIIIIIYYYLKLKHIFEIHS